MSSATKPNAGYKIDSSKTQEEQLFNDTDIYAADIYSDGECLYPFDFKNELLYAKNVTFHNNKYMQWDKNSLRKNDMIIAATKRLNTLNTLKNIYLCFVKLLNLYLK